MTPEQADIANAFFSAVVGPFGAFAILLTAFYLLSKGRVYFKPSMDALINEHCSVVADKDKQLAHKDSEIDFWKATVLRKETECAASIAEVTSELRAQYKVVAEQALPAILHFSERAESLIMQGRQGKDGG